MLDMMNTIDTTFMSTPVGGVVLKTPGPGSYTGPGNAWVEGTPQSRTLKLVNIQPVNDREIQIIQDRGGATNIEDMRKVYINDGTSLGPSDEDGNGNLYFSQWLEFSDGTAVRQWKVVAADNRPWRKYCKALVVRYRGER